MHATITRGGLLAAIAAMLAPRLAMAEDLTCDCVKTERSVANIEATLVRYVFDAGDRHALVQQQISGLQEQIAGIGDRLTALETALTGDPTPVPAQAELAVPPPAAQQPAADDGDTQIVVAGSTVIKDGKIVDCP